MLRLHGESIRNSHCASVVVKLQTGDRVTSTRKKGRISAGWTWASPYYVTRGNPTLSSNVYSSWCFIFPCEAVGGTRTETRSILQQCSFVRHFSRLAWFYRKSWLDCGKHHRLRVRLSFLSSAHATCKTISRSQSRLSTRPGATQSRHPIRRSRNRVTHE